MDNTHPLLAHTLCPISNKVMQDPVLLAKNGITYDRQSILGLWKAFGKKVDPESNEVLTDEEAMLIPSIQVASFSKEINNINLHAADIKHAHLPTEADFPYLICPISLRRMKDPVILEANGVTYERSSIETYLSGHNSVDPHTEEPLAADKLRLIPDRNLCAFLHELEANQAILALADEMEATKGLMALSQPQTKRARKSGP